MLSAFAAAAFDFAGTIDGFVNLRIAFVINRRGTGDLHVQLILDVEIDPRDAFTVHYAARRVETERATTTEVHARLATAREEAQRSIVAEAEETERLRAELEQVRAESERALGAERAEVARLREELLSSEVDEDADEASRRMIERVTRDLERERAISRNLKRELDTLRSETADRLTRFFREIQLNLSPEEENDIAFAFRELLMNAVEHGGKFDPEKKVEVAYIRLNGAIIYYVRDPGQGFSFENLRHSAVANAAGDVASHVAVRQAAGLRPGGFGILLMRNIADEVVYNEMGNEVILVKYARAEAAP